MFDKKNKKKDKFNKKKTHLSKAAKRKEEEEWKAYDFLRPEKKDENVDKLDSDDLKEINEVDIEDTPSESDIDDNGILENIKAKMKEEYEEPDDFNDIDIDTEEKEDEDIEEIDNPIFKSHEVESDSFKSSKEDEEDIDIYKDFSVKTRDDDEEGNSMSSKKKNSKNKKYKNKGKGKNDKELNESSLVKYKKGEKAGKKKKKKHNIFFRIFRFFFILGILAVIAAVAVVYAIFKTDKWTITREELLSDGGAIIYDINGNELVELTGDEINKKIPLEDMGKIPDAFIAIEDERFYSHHGVDFKRTAAAIFTFITHGGKSSFGGSTITQQLVKITMKDDDSTGINGVQRKIREWSRAYKVEDMLSKDEILARYLNRIFLGSAPGGLEVRGAEAASKYYFNKSAKDLSIAEAAFIAGINHAPNNYNPFATENHDEIMEKIKTRTLNTIGKMHDLGKITDEEYNTAVEQTKAGLTFTQGDVSNGKNNLSYHTAAAINQIAQELADKRDLSYSEARELLINSGYKIYTTEDPNVQSKIEEIFKNTKYQAYGSTARGKTSSGKEERIGQSGMTIIDPSTGYIVAECGGLGNQNTLGLNRGLTKRQAGSSFKPLATVAPGLENGYITASTLFYDVNRTSFGKYRVSNDDGSSHGVTNMRYILQRSLNVPEVKLLSIMGTEQPAEFLTKIDIPVDPDNAGLSFALGSVEVSTVQMAAGFAMIQNKGIYISPTFYTKVVDAAGEEVIAATQKSERMMSEQNAYIETSLLKGPVKAGTASQFSNFLGSMGVAGKTGTTDNYIDRWFCGFTPYYAAACWYGNDANNAAFGNGVNGRGNPAANVWFNVMKLVSEDQEKKDFDRPDGIVSRTICRASGKIAKDGCTDTYSEIFNKDSLPGTCDGHTSVRICTETGKLATDFCPNVEEKSFAVIDTEKNAAWSPKLESTEAPTESCDVHTHAPEIDVPNVVGMKEAEAKAKLISAGFVVDASKKDDNVAYGIVAKQSALKAPAGATIVLTIGQKKNVGPVTPPGNEADENTIHANKIPDDPINPPIDDDD